ERRAADRVEREMDLHRNGVLHAQLVVGEVRVDRLGAADGLGRDALGTRAPESQKRGGEDERRTDDVVDSPVDARGYDPQLADVHRFLRFLGSGSGYRRERSLHVPTGLAEDELGAAEERHLTAVGVE